MDIIFVFLFVGNIYNKVLGFLIIIVWDFIDNVVYRKVLSGDIVLEFFVIILLLKSYII